MQDLTGYQCQRCSAFVERKPTKGQRPKWCPGCRKISAHKHEARICEICNAQYSGIGKKYCSIRCVTVSQRKPYGPQLPAPKKTPAPKKPRTMVDTRSPLRKAVESGDHDEIIRVVLERTIATESGCREWQGKVKDGYPYVNVGNRMMQVHRVTLEAKLKASLGSQAAHHICANSRCVNPQHLQPVTHRENVAEMLARTSYLKRIAELEDALREALPDHPLLTHVKVA